MASQLDASLPQLQFPSSVNWQLGFQFHYGGLETILVIAAMQSIYHLRWRRGCRRPQDLQFPKKSRFGADLRIEMDLNLDFFERFAGVLRQTRGLEELVYALLSLKNLLMVSARVGLICGVMVEVCRRE